MALATHFVCPQCGRPLVPAGSAIRCDAGHSYDVARQGYVNLLPGGARSGTADTPPMLDARASFLGGEGFRPLTRAVTDAVASAASDVPGHIVDVGAGTGHYLAAALDAVGDRTGIALDISKHAARRAAGAHPRIVAAVTDAWGRLPLPDGCAAAVMSVFAPRNAAEFARVLHPRGALVVAAPTPDHLAELIAAVGLVSVDPDKEARIAKALDGAFECVARTPVEAPLSLDVENALAAVAMGPSAHHADAAELRRRIASVGDRVETRLSVVVSTWKPVRIASD